MNNIFLRIYAGILLMVLVIGALSYGSVKLVDHYRAQHYRQQMAHGTFYLIAQGVERYTSPQRRQQWLDAVGRLVGADIGIATAKKLGLTPAERTKLAGGKVVLRLNNAENSAAVFYALTDGQHYIYTHLSKISEQQARATALLVIDAMGQQPRKKWPTFIEKLQQQFGFPVFYQAASKIKLDKEQTQRLQRQEVVLSINNADNHSSSSVTIYAAIGTSGDVLVMGPLYLFDPYPVEMLALIGLLGLLLLALVAYFLVRPLQTRLGHLEKVIKRLGEGDLSARIEGSRADAIGQLATTFNGMSQHVQRLIESQREMTRAVSHELRTPVARLRFGIEMLLDCDAATRARRIDELDSDIDQLNALIDEILTFAKLQEGMPAIEFEAVFIPDLMEQIRAELQPLSPDVSIEIDSSWQDLSQADCHAAAERRYLHRILQNLVTNAVRYGDSQVRIRYRLDNTLACLEVDDNGAGIPEADRVHVFEPFARLDKSRQSGGYGLGLSIVQRIMEWHGGKVTVGESDLGGASFRVAWPRLHNNAHVLAGRDAQDA